MGKSNTSDAQALIRSLCSAYSATPTNLKIVDLYVIFAVFTAAVQLYGKGDEARDRLGSVSCFRLSVHTMPLTVRFKLQKPDDANILHREPTRPLFSSRQLIYIGIVGTFPFNSFLSGALSCAGTAVFAVCLRIQVNKENKEFKDLPPERAFADFVLCNLVLHLVITNFLG